MKRMMLAVIIILIACLAWLLVERSKIQRLELKTASRVIVFIDGDGKDVGRHEFLEEDEVTTRLMLRGE